MTRSLAGSEASRARGSSFNGGLRQGPPGYGRLMNDQDPQTQLDEAKSDADEDLGDMEEKADEMEERLDENESIGEDVEVPDPEEGDSLSI
jgi:hypothetical protein